jgi:hypothetical protein
VDRTSKGWIDYETGTERPKPRRRPATTTDDTGDLFAPVVPAARTTDPETSNEGIRDVLPRAGSQQYKLLLAYASRPMGLIAEEAAEIAGLNRAGVCFWKRTSEMRSAGLIEDTHTTRTASTGSVQRVCAITEKGKEAVCAARSR